MMFDFILRSEVGHLSGLLCKITQSGKRNVDQQKHFSGYLNWSLLFVCLCKSSREDRSARRIVFKKLMLAGLVSITE